MNDLNLDFVYSATGIQAGLEPDLLHHDRRVARVERAVAQLRRRLVGQDRVHTLLGQTLASRSAQRAVGWPRAVQTLRPNWDGRPWACLLALGPTGTGKTETAKILAEELFGGRLVMLHGSEVGPEAAHGTSVWTGSPPGYVGSDRGGVLTDTLRRHSSGVILIDEIEKASPHAVQNVLIPLMGEGTVTDRNNGETLGANNYVVFCTSNIEIRPDAAHALGLAPSAPTEVGHADLFASISRHLLPEVIARFHGVLLYESLDLDAQWRIWSSLRQELEDQLGSGTRILLDIPARRMLQLRFQALETGARGVVDLFHDQIVPLVTDTRPGDTLQLTANGERLAPSAVEIRQTPAATDASEPVGKSS